MFARQHDHFSWIITHNDKYGTAAASARELMLILSCCWCAMDIIIHNDGTRLCGVGLNKHRTDLSAISTYPVQIRGKQVYCNNQTTINQHNYLLNGCTL